MRFVDYGNVVTVTPELLRKDLYGLEVPKLAVAVTLKGIQITSGFDAYQIHSTFYDKWARIVVEDEKIGLPLRVKMQMYDHGDDLAEILVKNNQAEYLDQ